MQGTHLDKVIQCIQQHQKTLPSKPNPTEDISIIHHVTIDLLDKFSEHIDRCKKYNQARIHRKYENTLSYLQEENAMLKAKLALQRNAQPGSQKYVSELIDRMVELRAVNEQLVKENQHMRVQVSLRKESLEQSKGGSFDQSNQARIVKEAVAKFTRIRKQERAKQPRQTSNFQKFLEFNSSKASKWTLFELFQRMEKWILNLKDTRFLDSQRIRKNFDRSYTSIQQAHPPINLRRTEAEQHSISSSKIHTQQISNSAHEQFTILRRKRRNPASLLPPRLRSTLRSQQTITHDQ